MVEVTISDLPTLSGLTLTFYALMLNLIPKYDPPEMAKELFLFLGGLVLVFPSMEIIVILALPDTPIFILTLWLLMGWVYGFAVFANILIFSFFDLSWFEASNLHRRDVKA